jgi:hypothetical protein
MNGAKRGSKSGQQRVDLNFRVHAISRRVRSCRIADAIRIGNDARSSPLVLKQVPFLARRRGELCMALLVLLLVLQHGLAPGDVLLLQLQQPHKHALILNACHTE